MWLWETMVTLKAERQKEVSKHLWVSSSKHGDNTIDIVVVDYPRGRKLGRFESK